MSIHYYCNSYKGEPTVDIAQHLGKIEEMCEGAGFVLEIGCGAGNGSTRAIQAALEKTQGFRLHVSVDADPYQPRYERPDVAWWWKVQGDSREPETALRVLAIAGKMKADVIFIDTDHVYDVMQKELPLWAQFAHSGTVWLFHDTWMGGPYNHMTDAIKEFAVAEGWVYTDLSTSSHGLGMMRR